MFEETQFMNSFLLYSIIGVFTAAQSHSRECNEAAISGKATTKCMELSMVNIEENAALTEVPWLI